MQTIGSYQAKTNLSKLLEQVAQGKGYIITKHGVPIAMLVPPKNLSSVDYNSAVLQMKDFTNSMKTKITKKVSIKEMKNEGRKY